MVAKPMESTIHSSPPQGDLIGVAGPKPDVIVDVVATSEQARADLHVQTICMLILAFLAAGIGLVQLRPVLVPFVLALFFAACLKPVIEWQRRYLRAPQPVAVAGALLMAVAILGGIGIPLTSSIEKTWPNFEKQFHQFGAWITQAGPLARFGLSADMIRGDLSTWTDSLSTAGGIASRTFLVIVFTLFILLGRPGQKRRANGILAEIEVRVQVYISQMVLLSAVAGIGVGAALFALGVQFAAMFGFLAFLLNFIPTIGSIIATLLPLPIILLNHDMPLAFKVLALAVPAVFQIYLGNAVQPRVLGNALDLHPIVILLSLIFWSMIWGVAGAFLATPMTAVLRIVLEKIPATRPLANLLAGRIDAVF
jgi:AI-2 transport protein TqsA